MHRRAAASRAVNIKKNNGFFSFYFYNALRKSWRFDARQAARARGRARRALVSTHAAQHTGPMLVGRFARRRLRAELYQYALWRNATLALRVVSLVGRIARRAKPVCERRAVLRIVKNGIGRQREECAKCASAHRRQVERQWRLCASQRLSDTTHHSHAKAANHSQLLCTTHRWLIFHFFFRFAKLLTRAGGRALARARHCSASCPRNWRARRVAARARRARIPRST